MEKVKVGDQVPTSVMVAYLKANPTGLFQVAGGGTSKALVVKGVVSWVFAGITQTLEAREVPESTCARGGYLPAWDDDDMWTRLDNPVLVTPPPSPRPGVGDKVSWSLANLDMDAHPQARYQRGWGPDHYRILDGQLQYNRGSAWVESALSFPERCPWTRMPDEEVTLPTTDRVEAPMVRVLAPPARNSHQWRKARPLALGCVFYFPDALLEVAFHSVQGNEQHNPGQPLHWNYGKSMDHVDCEFRHAIDARNPDPNVRREHLRAKAWRSLADLQTFEEEQDPELHKLRQAEREAAARGK